LPTVAIALVVLAICLIGISIFLGAAYIVYGPKRKLLLDFMALSFSVGVLALIALIVYALVISAESINE
jgi:hypothetical protein